MSAMMGKHRDLKVEGMRLDQLGTGFWHLARPDWDKGGKTLPSRGKGIATQRQERERERGS